MSKYAEVSKGEGGSSNQPQDGGRDAEAGYGFGPIGPSLYEYNDRPRRDLCRNQYFLPQRSLLHSFIMTSLPLCLHRGDDCVPDRGRARHNRRYCGLRRDRLRCLEGKVLNKFLSEQASIYAWAGGKAKHGIQRWK